MGMTHEEKLEHQLDAERAVIGSLLIDPEIVQPALRKVQEADFSNPANRLIFQTARTLFRHGTPPDAVTIRDRIGPQYSQYMAELMDITPTSANWEAYADAMHEQATVRRIRDLADKLQTAVTLDDCRPLAAELSQQLSDGTSVDTWSMREMLEDFFAAQDPDAPTPQYITYGLPMLDGRSYTKPGDVVILGGYPSDGKTAMALSMAYHMAKSQKVGFFSLETDKHKLRDRLISSVAQIDFDAIKRRQLTEGDWQNLAIMSAELAKRDLTFLQASGMTATDIQGVSQAYGFDVIFIDYVQLVVPEVSTRAPRSEQMADVSRQLHTFAQKSRTLVVELAQLSRADKSSSWREPVMSDLKESGQFEQDADMIFLLFRPNPKSATERMEDEGDLDRKSMEEIEWGLVQKERERQREITTQRILKVAKNKEGPRGKWLLYFDGPRQTFSPLTKG